MSTLDNLRKSARRWLKALRAQDPDARARLTRATPDAPENAGLRDVQHALARERGYVDWTTLRRSLEHAHSRRDDVAQFENIAHDFLLAYKTGDAAALQRLGAHLQVELTRDSLRAEVQRRLDDLPASERPGGELTLPDVYRFLARAANFSSWEDLVQALRRDYSSGPSAPPRTRIPPLDQDARTGMLRPIELRLELPMELADGVYATTTDVWKMLVACAAGDADVVRALVSEIPALARCEYNYMPPMHLAVREGHEELVQLLLDLGAYDPAYRTYPYKETLLTMAAERGHSGIAAMLHGFAGPVSPPRRHGAVQEVGHIEFPPDEDRDALEQLVNANAIGSVEALLDRRPDLATDELAFYAEGILALVANRTRRPMMELLLARGASVPAITKWGRFYYFKHEDIAALLLERGMNPNHMTWHRTTLLHDMAGEGNVSKARLLLKHGASINILDDEFRSTPLAFAARWGRREAVRLLLEHGADPNMAGAPWATPLAWAQKRGHEAIAADLRAADAT
jgi:ankyrin repeat protein